MNRVCKPNETVAEYGHALQRLAIRAYPGTEMAEQVMIDMYIKGLPDLPMRRHVHTAKPATLSEAITTAVAYQAFDNCQIVAPPRKPANTSRVANVVTAAPPSEKRGNSGNTHMVSQPMHRSNYNGQRPLRPRRDLSTVECFRCHQMGHYSRDCSTNSYNPRMASVQRPLEVGSTQESPLNV